MQDLRAYKFIITQYSKDPPSPEQVFPLLEGFGKTEQAVEPVDDEMIFHQVTASLSQTQQTAK